MEENVKLREGVEFIITTYIILMGGIRSCLRWRENDDDSELTPRFEDGKRYFVLHQYCMFYVLTILLFATASAVAEFTTKKKE